MKITLIIISVLIVLIIIILFILGKYSQHGQAPGLRNGVLSKCSDKPNCVCSEYRSDVDHYIKPITSLQKKNQAITSEVLSIIKSMNGEQITSSDNYIAATFSSSIFGFVDDFEVRVDANQKVVHFRSASRVGYGDGGVNRKRVELFKRLYKNNAS